MAFVQVRRSLAPLVRGAGTTNGTGWPLYDTDRATALIVSGAIADGSHVVKVQESDTLGGTYTDIPAGRTDSGPTLTSTDGSKLWMVDFQVAIDKPYARVVIVTTGGTAANSIGAYILQTIGVDLPPSNPAT